MAAFEIFHGMKRKGDGRVGLMAFKLDMSKAYDIMEWSFLEKVMIKMGFCSAWISKIMNCFSCVSYSFKLNRSVKGNITPSRDCGKEIRCPFIYLSYVRKLSLVRCLKLLMMI